MPTYDCSDINGRVIDLVLSFQAQQCPDKTWLLSDSGQFTFKEADLASTKYAQALQRLGVTKGSLVACMMTSSPNVVLLFMATLKAGGTFAIFDTELKGRFLKKRIVDSEATLIFTDEEHQDLFLPFLSLLDGRLIEVAHWFSACPNIEACGESHLSEPASNSPYDPAIVWWTSGTTGSSKGVTHSHGSSLFLAGNVASRFDSDEVSYCCTPLYLGGAWVTSLLPSLVSGTTVAIDPKFSVSRYWKRINHFKATRALLLGAMHQYLVDKQEAHGGEPVESTLRTACCIPIRRDEATRFKELFGVADIPQSYGMSETGPIFTLENDGEDCGDNAVGEPVPHFEVRLVDDNGRAVEAGQPGELYIRPKYPLSMFMGYYHDPENTASVYSGEWFHCGDILRLGDDGVYYFMGRKKDYIRHKGRNVSLFEIDCITQEHPAVAQAAAFGVQAQDNPTEEDIALAVVLQQGATLTANELIDYVGQNAPYYMVPRYVIFVDDLPRNDSKRVMRYQLRQNFDPSTCWDRGTQHYHSPQACIRNISIALGRCAASNECIANS